MEIGIVNDIDFFKSNSKTFNYAILANGCSGLMIIDISEPSLPSYVKGFATPGEAISLSISGEYAYVTYEDCGENGLLVVDISDPTSPSSRRPWASS